MYVCMYVWGLYVWREATDAREEGMWTDCERTDGGAEDDIDEQNENGWGLK